MKMNVILNTLDALEAERDDARIELERTRNILAATQVELDGADKVIATLRAELVRLGGGGGVLVGRCASPAEKGHNEKLSDSGEER